MSSTGSALRWWDAALIGTSAVASTTILISATGSAAAWGATGSLAGAVAVYLALGRRALMARNASGLTRWASAMLIVAVVLAAWFNPIAQIVQAVLYPLLWRLSSNTRTAIGRSAALAVGIGLTVGLGRGDWVTAALNTALVLIFTIAIGLWITRIQKYAMERDQLLTELRVAQAEVASLERQAGITEERARVAREIHDTIAQTLTGLVMTAQRANSIAARAPESLGPTLALMENLATEALAEARTLVASYTPVSVSGGLPATLAVLADRFSAETGVTVIVSGEAPDVDREAEVVLLRCAQEALANVRKHAHARQVRVSIDATDDGAGLTVTDDGVGIGTQDGNGYGLAGMAERVRLVGGTVEVGPDVSGGTTVRVALPRRSGAEVVS